MQTETKNCILYHKNVPVLRFSMCGHQITKLGEVLCAAHAPVGTRDNVGVDWKKFLDWFELRGIPASRDHIHELLDQLGLRDVRELATGGLSLSLSDQYWVCPEGADLAWEQVNFFQNDFSEEWGNVLLGEENLIDSRALDLNTPDGTSEGWLRKRWKISSGRRYLYKAGSAPYFQEPLNEVIAGILCRRLHIRHVAYELVRGRADRPYSVCEDYITPDTELITAWQIVRMSRRCEGESYVAQYLRTCRELGLQDIESEFSRMVAVDYILANTDRHWANFGIVRDANDLHFLETFPIFDTGTSLWNTVQTARIGEEEVQGRLLGCAMDAHVPLITDTDFLDFEELLTFPEEAQSVLASSAYISAERAGCIAEALRGRIHRLERLLCSGNTFIREPAAGYATGLPVGGGPDGSVQLPDVPFR